MSLEIRRVTRDDTDALLQVIGDPKVARWLRAAGRSGPFTRAECEEIIVKKLVHWTAHVFGVSLGFSEGRWVGRATVRHNPEKLDLVYERDLTHNGHPHALYTAAA